MRSHWNSTATIASGSDRGAHSRSQPTRWRRRWRKSDKPFLLLGGDGWHAGVVGIIAGRLKERHARPALVVGFDGSDEHGDRARLGTLGCRRRSRRDHSRGASRGHSRNGGATPWQRGFRSEEPARRVRRISRGTIGPQRAVISKASDLVIDALVSASGAHHALLDDLDRAGPYGAGHPEPTFVLSDMLVVYAGTVGTNHVRLRLVGRDGQGLGASRFAQRVRRWARRC
jgi:single-stranded-DNA-specific exonuclease